jgi:hypothetical protein
MQTVYYSDTYHVVQSIQHICLINIVYRSLSFVFSPHFLAFVQTYGTACKFFLLRGYNVQTRPFRWLKVYGDRTWIYAPHADCRLHCTRQQAPECNDQCPAVTQRIGLGLLAKPLCPPLNVIGMRSIMQNPLLVYLIMDSSSLHCGNCGRINGCTACSNKNAANASMHPCTHSTACSCCIHGSSTCDT